MMLSLYDTVTIAKEAKNSQKAIEFLEYAIANCI